MDGASAGASTVESSLAATLGPTVAERFITMPRLCTEIIEDSLPRVGDSERAGLRIAVDAGLAQQAADMRAHLEATPGRPTASPGAIAGLPLTGALKGTEPTLATEDSPAATEVSLDADQARRVLVVSAAAAAVSRADPLRTEVSAVRTVADTLAADTPAVDTAAVEVTVAAATAAGAKSSVLSSPFQPQIENPALTSGVFLLGQSLGSLSRANCLICWHRLISIRKILVSSLGFQSWPRSLRKFLP